MELRYRLGPGVHRSPRATGHGRAYALVLSRIDDGELGDIDPTVRQFRYRNALFTVVRTLAEYETILADGGEFDERLRHHHLVDAVAGMMAAPDHTGLLAG